MTPMLDIVFIMLIFFVVTASFVQESGLAVNRPQGPPVSSQSTEDGLLLQLAPGHRIIFRGYTIDVLAATALMKKFHVEHGDKIILVKLEAGAKLGQLVSLLDHGRMAGLPHGSIAVL